MPIRITGGFFRGRNVASPESNKTRPTASRTREALFNILQSVESFSMLDLYAGTGIMGIEALSRGANSVTAVEFSKSQGNLIFNAYKQLDLLPKLNLLIMDVLKLSKDKLCLYGNFDLIYADPPFKDEKYPDLREFLNCVNNGGYLVLEVPSRSIPDWAKNDIELKKARIYKYGESSLLIYRCNL